ncbi:hypothetical protein Hdeb2414_s0007g00243391 [Helianthus debilis subsp. tardiflorus]
MPATGGGGTAAVPPHALATATFPAGFLSIRYPTPAKRDVPDTMAATVFKDSEPFGLTRNSSDAPVKFPANTFQTFNSVPA